MVKEILRFNVTRILTAVIASTRREGSPFAMNDHYAWVDICSDSSKLFSHYATVASYACKIHKPAVYHNLYLLKLGCMYMA